MVDICYTVLVGGVLSNVVYLIRHGEKPWNHHSLKHSGDWDGVLLSKHGERRAECITNLFNATFNSTFKTPTTIIAKAFGRDGVFEKYNSHRSYDTVSRLAQNLNTNIETCRRPNCVVDLINKTQQGTILVSFKRSYLKDILQKLDVNDVIDKYPHYPSDRFDLVWEFDTDKNTLNIHEQNCSAFNLFRNGTNTND
jgi:hypothetical protein